MSGAAQLPGSPFTTEAVSGGALVRCRGCAGEMVLSETSSGGDLYHSPGCQVLDLFREAAAVRKPVVLMLAGRPVSLTHRREPMA